MLIVSDRARVRMIVRAANRKEELGTGSGRSKWRAVRRTHTQEEEEEEEEEHEEEEEKKRNTWRRTTVMEDRRNTRERKKKVEGKESSKEEQETMSTGLDDQETAQVGRKIVERIDPWGNCANL